MSVKATLYGQDYTRAEIDSALSNKQNTLAFDDYPVANSNNPVKSSGIKAKLDEKQNLLTFDVTPTSGSNNAITSGAVYDALSTKQNNLTFDNQPTLNSQNLVKSGAIASALGNKQNTLTFDESPTLGSNNPVKSKGIASALNTKQNLLTFDGQPAANSEHAITSGAVYTALANKQDRLSFDNQITQNSPNMVTSGVIYQAIQSIETTGGSVIIDSDLSVNSSNPVANSAITTAINTINTNLNNKADTNHAVSNTNYGAATSTQYGHVRITDSLTTTSPQNNPIAASATAVKTLNESLATKQDNLTFPLAINLGGTGNNTGYIRAGLADNITAGSRSTAEGYNTSSTGSNSHAEGNASVASGGNAHAEGGGSTAIGAHSHSEGSQTIAAGFGSHADGQGTVARYLVQHVFGRYNLVDDNGEGVPNDLTTLETSSDQGNYIEIVGNGTSSSGNITRRNARTLDWYGNEILSGKLTVGTAPTEDMDVATKQYVDTNVTSLTSAIDGKEPAITGQLLVSKGGTGRSSFGINSVILANDTTTSGQFSYAQSKSGALYAEANNATPKFGTLPVAQGGTGITTLENGKLLQASSTSSIGFIDLTSTPGTATNQVITPAGVNASLGSPSSMAFTTSSDDLNDISLTPGYYKITTNTLHNPLSGSTTAGLLHQLSFASNSLAQIVIGTRGNGVFYRQNYSSTITTETWSEWKSLIPSAASTSAAGIVQLSDATNSSSSSIAATSKAVKAAYDLANGKAAASHNHAASDINSGTLGVARGGTGSSSFTANSLVISNTSTTGGLITLSNVADGSALVSKGTTTLPAWQAISPSVSITAGTSSAAPKIGISVLGQNGTAQSITTASTSLYGVTKLSSSISSTSEALAATPKAVKTAYDLANTINTNISNLTSKTFSSRTSITLTNITAPFYFQVLHGSGSDIILMGYGIKTSNTAGIASANLAVDFSTSGRITINFGALTCSGWILGSSNFTLS